MIKFVKDIDLINEEEQYDVILIGTTYFCMLSGGFQSKMRYKYPIIEQEDDKQPYGDKRRLGTHLTVNITDNHAVSLMYICGMKRHSRCTLDYNALEKCLLTANAEFAGKKCAATIIGASRFDGCGEREKCLELIERCTPQLDLTIYDYQQLTVNEDIRKLSNGKWYRLRDYKFAAEHYLCRRRE